jgi:hypothetical protein
MKTEYRVKANINGNRIETDKGLFKTKTEASNFALQTNKFNKKSNARVIKITKKS